VWVETPERARVVVSWPYGFYARFAPDLLLYSGDGQLVAKSGDRLDLGGAGTPTSSGFMACIINGQQYVWPGP